MAKLVSWGLLLVAAAELAWVLPFGGSYVDVAALLVGAAGAIVATRWAPVGGMMAVTMSWAYFATVFALSGGALGDWGVAALIAAGLAFATWGFLVERASWIAAGFALAGIVEAYWIWANLRDGQIEFVLGNVLFAGGALLAAWGARPRSTPA